MNLKREKAAAVCLPHPTYTTLATSNDTNRGYLQKVLMRTRPQDILRKTKESRKDVGGFNFLFIWRRLVLRRALDS